MTWDLKRNSSFITIEFWRLVGRWWGNILIVRLDGRWWEMFYL
jgi:hypothetical protein